MSQLLGRSYKHSLFSPLSNNPLSHHLPNTATEGFTMKYSLCSVSVYTAKPMHLLLAVCLLGSCHHGLLCSLKKALGRAPGSCLLLQSSLFKCQYWFVKHEQSWGVESNYSSHLALLLTLCGAASDRTAFPVASFIRSVQSRADSPSPLLSRLPFCVRVGKPHT